MYAIVRDRSRCLTLRAGDELWVDRMPEAEAGSEVVFDQVQLLKKEDGSVAVGTPHVDGASVVARSVLVVRGFCCSVGERWLIADSRRGGQAAGVRRSGERNIREAKGVEQWSFRSGLV